MNEELISQIVQHILTDSSFQALLNGYRSGVAEKTAAQKPALVLLNYVTDFEALLNAVKTRWGREYMLTVLPSKNTVQANPELPEGLNWTTPQEALAKTDWAQILVPACSANTLAKAALGIRDNPLSELIGRGIVQGIPIALVAESLGLTAQTPQAYRELYDDYLQTIQTYGVQVFAKIGDQKTLTFPEVKAVSAASTNSTSAGISGINAGAGMNASAVINAGISTAASNTSPVVTSRGIDTNAFLKAIITAAEPNPKTSQSYPGQGFAPGKGLPGTASPEEIRFDKKFLGDKEAYAFPEASRVLVSRYTVISPLARDTLRLRRVELCITEEGRG